MAAPTSNGSTPLPPRMDTMNSANEPGRDASSTLASTSPQEISFPTPTFQAVNVQAVAQNARTSVNSGVSDPKPPPEPAAVTQSDPQATQPPSEPSQASKIPVLADGQDGAMSADGATYGTRSRNRAGNARPNYAEDQEMEFEYSANASSKKKAAAGTDPTSQASLNGAEAKRARDFAHLLDGGNGGTPPVANAVAGRESTPIAAPAPSKKRKAAGPPSTLTQTPSATNSPLPSASRKVAPPSVTTRETNIMSFSKHRHILSKKGELIADDGTKLSVNDHVYLVCEPPGEPYYLCRVMEFLHVRSDDPTSPVDAIRVNWYYRPRDIARFNADTRLLYATMHSDICPLTSLRGKCTIKHRSEIEDLEVYRKERDSFYFVQVFDRFIRRQYECIPVAQIINVPDKVKKALDERWKFVVVEIGRVKELTSAVKTCKRCTRYCASQDSVDCAICKNSYHMDCVQPPLPKKPSRGFAWACGPCSRASEKKLEQRNTPTVSGDVTEAEEEENVEEEVPSASNDTTRAPSPSGVDMPVDDHPATQAEMALAKMWPMRYLGIHARVEDALQYDDRAIYPRASSRLGPRHQANVPMWHGQPVELVKAADIKKKYAKNNSHKKDGKLTKETIAALEADREEKAKRPKWVQDEPPGYVPRGEDYDNDDPRNTSRLLFKIPEEPEDTPTKPATSKVDQNIEAYLIKARAMAREIGVPPFGANFIDKALELLTKCNFDQAATLKQLSKVHRVKDLHEPVLSKAELLKFEEGVSLYGSEHRLVRLHMKTTLPHADIVRFYYLWKKTPKGREIWGNFGGRKGGSRRRLENDAGALVQQSVTNDADDSAYDNDKASQRIKGFQCKHCNTTHSRQWRRAPGVSPGQTIAADAKSGKEKGTKLLLALCLRCAGLWRKYAIQWEDIDEVAKKVAQGGGRAWKRKIDEELLRELIAANEAAAAAATEAPTAVPSAIETSGEPPKKKNKVDDKKKEPPPPPPPKEPTPPPPPIIPNQPQWKVLPCAVCKIEDNTIACAHCRLTVHRHCFGLSPDEGVKADGQIYWVCEQCQNDKNPQVSTDYSCCLCLTEETLIDLVEPPRVSHKKKTDREREKERMEKELADTMRSEYRNKQLNQNRPTSPREPLKRTAGNNWVHVYCAVWTPEVRFSQAKTLEVAEGFQQIQPARHEAVCKLCKNKDHQNRVREDKGACVGCFQCAANFHISCAFEAGYVFGFDVTPVKGSRKDSIITATLATETGAVTAGIWCKEHVVKSVIHPVNEIADAESGRTAMQVFVESYKQADLTLTGTVRKANMVQMTKEKGQQANAAGVGANRRESTANSIAAAVRRGARTSLASQNQSEGDDGVLQSQEVHDSTAERRCMRCKIDVTPKWHQVDRQRPPKEPTPPRSPQPAPTASVEFTDRQREQLNGEYAPTHSSSTPEQPRQGIRFMPPGANGRAWQGVAEHWPSGVSDGMSNTYDTSSVQVRELPNGAVNGEVHHNHSGPPHRDSRFVNHAAGRDERLAVGEKTQDYLCHKCFLKKKLDPTPPPEDEPPAPAASQSPPRPYSVQPPGWNGPPGPPPPGYEHNPLTAQPPRAPWEEPSREHQPPPQVNGLGLTNYAPHAPPVQSYPPYGPPPNGYPGPVYGPQYPGAPPPPQHFGPPPHQHHGPPPMHERHPSYGYAPPPQPNPSGPPPPHYGPPRPSPLQGFPPPGQLVPNGMASPRGPQFQPAMPSPTHPGPPQQGPPHQGPPHPGYPHQAPPQQGPPHQAPTHHPAYGPWPPHHSQSNDSPFAMHGQPPMGAPQYSSPQYARPEPVTSQPQPPYPPPQQQYQAPPQPQPSTPQPQQHTPQQVVSGQYFARPHTSPQESQERQGDQAERQDILRPETVTSQPTPQHPVPPHQPAVEQQLGTPQPQQQTPQQQTADPHFAQPHASPHISQNQPNDQAGRVEEQAERPQSQAGRPETPQAGQVPGQDPGTPTLNAAGASASPNLKNLLS